jgi:hypothetical protein
MRREDFEGNLLKRQVGTAKNGTYQYKECLGSSIGVPGNRVDFGKGWGPLKRNQRVPQSSVNGSHAYQSRNVRNGMLRLASGWCIGRYTTVK